MDTDDLPSDFDVIVLGTGLTETIVAAAFSRIGLKVLHLDRNNYYGGSYANFNLQGIEEWKQRTEDLTKNKLNEHVVTEDLKHLAGDGKTLHCLPCEISHVDNIKINFHIRRMTAEEKMSSEMSRERTQSKSLSPVELSEFTITVDSSLDKASSESFEQIQDNGVGGASSGGKENIEQLADRLEKEDIGTNTEVKEAEDTQDKKEEVASAAKESELSESSSLENSSEESQHDWTVEAIQEDWRKFCFDLSPRVLYCSGELVELLIQSDVARYCEFRTVSRVLTLLNDSLQQVPCSRADVFSSKIVSLVEKRLMMKFLQFAADYENHPQDYIEFQDKPFVDFLKSKKLSPNIQHFVQYAIAMVNSTASTLQGLKRTQQFLHSLGRYGNTAFLFSLYGSGELPQAFSRLSAVFGGTYCLMMSASHIIADEENKCCGIISSTNGKKINCKYLVAEASYLPSSFLNFSHQRKTSRAIYITNRSVHKSKEAELSLLNYVCSSNSDMPVTLMEIPHSACVCPKGMFVVHLTRESISTDPQQDFEELNSQLFTTDKAEVNKPMILWSLYYTQDDLSDVSLTPDAIGNLFVTSGGGDACIDMEKSVEEARRIFHLVCPTEEFLAKPPNPEDIIYVDDEEAAVSKGPGEFEVSSDSN